MIELFEFQREAADFISHRYAEYWDDPAVVGRQSAQRALPFFQSLASITASGKTVILAATVADIASALETKPIVLWISRGKVVVEQTLSNLSDGGRYNHLLGSATVEPIAAYNAEDVRTGDRTLLYFATVGTFNQRDKDAGSRLIFRCDLDTADASTWDALKERSESTGRRRPLIIVYDEAHNLSDQQTDLLLELDPQAILLASATMRLPARLSGEIAELKRQTGHDDSWLITSVDSTAVADAGLVKSTVLMAGYKTPMEETIDALLADKRQAELEAAEQGLVGPLRAIYVSETNIVGGNAYQTDDPKQPFHERQAPPILIWRCLVEQHDIDPGDIAVYCSLKTHKDYPVPAEFNLFSGGDKDYSRFIGGGYSHIIFNLSLQEGWDDPLAYFAYIDKSMESRVQVEQVIGRLLRQPGAERFSVERLNTAHFYVRVDRNAVFDDLLREVAGKLSQDAPAVRLVSKPPDKPSPIELLPRVAKSVFKTGYDTTEAIDPIGNLIRNFPDYRNDGGVNTTGQGARKVVTRAVGFAVETRSEWESYKRSSLVSARWLFVREVRRMFQNALGICPTSEPKLDALIGVGSPAALQVSSLARNVVSAYIDNVYLKQRKPDPYEVGGILVREEDLAKFENSVHDGYEGLNQLEMQFARALDAVGVTWCRNPARTGYGIPLITPGTTSTFYPDFLAWTGERVVAIDTTGGHLLPEKAARKLMGVEPAFGLPRMAIRFVSRGTWDSNISQRDSVGFTVWEQSPLGERRAIVCETLGDAVERVLRA